MKSETTSKCALNPNEAFELEHQFIYGSLYTEIV